jgi:hypothetical protein
MRYLPVAAFVAAAALLPSCGTAHAGASFGGRPWWVQVRASACGPPAWVRFGGHVVPVGNCAGMLLVPAMKVTVHVGQRIDVHMTEEGAGPHGNRMVPATPLFQSSRQSVLKRGAISANRATGTYDAVRSGYAALTSSYAFCLHIRRHRDRETTGSCPVIEVTVIP